MKEDGSEAAETKKAVKSSSFHDSETKVPKRNASKHRPPPLMIDKKLLKKQMSMLETSREVAWERRRRQILRQERRRKGVIAKENGLTDEDLKEPKGCIELGFGFNEEDKKLCNTLPALDLYFTVNRRLSPFPSHRSQSYSSTPLPLLGKTGYFPHERSFKIDLNCQD
ncbi:lysosomal beta glucosidase-like [Hibiscus syriacus]|uniref:Lysosomal beta glucosidase-like n=1 Tax=Hibiscus syriacus TaxID=106335 RepID=A0A6A2XMI9_HIBSY|nr:lysosomal beta glucosidase-like [Hibiscus syriacus]